MNHHSKQLYRMLLIGLIAAGTLHAAPPKQTSPAIHKLSDAERNAMLAPGPVKQNSFEPCVPDFAPGDRYRTDKRGFQGCPTILRTRRGTLYAGWFAGGAGEGLLNYNLMVKSTNNGITWSQEPILVIPSRPDAKVQALDTQFWLDPQGKFWCFWNQRDYKYHIKDPRHASVWAIVCDDPDAARPVWSKVRYISPGILRCQPTALSDGRWILCAYDWTDDHYRYTETSDRGQTWQRRRGGRKYPTNFDETMLLERRDGSLWMLARTRYGSGALAESISNDGGGTWSDGKLTNIANPGSRFYLGRLRSGRVLLIGNDDAGERYHLTAQLSDDDGRTWRYRFPLDQRCCTYPDAVQAESGEIYLTHDYSRVTGKEILLYRLTEKDLMNGRDARNNLPDKDSFLAHIINKAPVVPRLTPEEKALFEKFRRKPKKTPVPQAKSPRPAASVKQK